MLNPALLTALGNILPAAAILTAGEDTRPYECDGLTIFRQQPGAVLLPENEAQVVAILKHCHAARIPVIARGAGTGLSGGVLPDPEGIILSLAKFQRILAIDPLARTATVQPGVRNLAISQATAPYGLYYAPDPSSQIACTIGGNVAENSGGVHCLKYGLTVHNVRRVRAVLMSGDVVDFGSEALDAPGYDLLALMSGSEGLLGVITEVTVKLTPKAQEAKCVLAAFDDVAKAGNAVAAVIGAGIVPSGLEMMDRLTIGAVEPFVHAGYPADAEMIIEGHILPQVRRTEGPFGEFTGHAVAQDERPVIEVSAITHRRNYIFQDIHAGYTEHKLMGAIPREAALLKAVRQTVPTVKNVCMPTSGNCRFHAYISIAKRTPGQAKNAICAAFAADMLLKHVVIVDEEIDVFDEEQVLWAISNRFQADRDLVVIANAQGSELDPTAGAGGVNTKMGLDATKPLGDFPAELRVPDDVMKRIRLEDFLPKLAK